MTALEVASFATAIASLVLAIVAIVLSIVFYKMTSELSESTKEAAKGIGASVDKLEKLFDRLYTDTFSMMKDTVTDMRKHAWGGGETSEQPSVLEEAERKADQKIEVLRERMEAQLTQILEGQQITDGRVATVRRELRELVDEAINNSRSVEHEVREEAIRTHIIAAIGALSKQKGQVTASDLVDEMMPKCPPPQLRNELKRMKQEGILKWSKDAWEPDTLFTLT